MGTVFCTEVMADERLEGKGQVCARVSRGWAMAEAWQEMKWHKEARALPGEPCRLCTGSWNSGGPRREALSQLSVSTRLGGVGVKEARGQRGTCLLVCETDHSQKQDTAQHSWAKLLPGMSQHEKLQKQFPVQGVLPMLHCVPQDSDPQAPLTTLSCMSPVQTGNHAAPTPSSSWAGGKDFILSTQFFFFNFYLLKNFYSILS